MYEFEVNKKFENIGRFGYRLIGSRIMAVRLYKKYFWQNLWEKIKLSWKVPQKNLSFGVDIQLYALPLMDKNITPNMGIVWEARL